MRAGFLLSVTWLLGAVPVGAQSLECGLPPGSERCEAWAATYGGPANGSDIANAAAMSPDGQRLFVTGASPGSGGNELATVAYNAATGAQLWAVRFLAGGGVAIAVSGDGSRVFVSGNSAGDYATIAYDAATGQELWVSMYDGGLGDSVAAMALGVEDATVYVGGYSDAPPAGNHMDYAVAAYDAGTGEERWTARYNGKAGFWDVLTDLAVGTEIIEVNGQERVADRVYVTGRSNVQSSANDHTDYVTVAYDDQGAMLWEAAYNGPSQGREYAYALTVSPDGGHVYVVGESAGAGFDYATVSYNARTGVREWVHRFERPQDDRPLGIAASPDGQRVFVTGFSFNGTHPFDRSVATVAIDASDGAHLWAALRTGPLGEAGRDVLVSPDGARVYVGGLSAGLVFGVGVNASGAALGFSGYLTAAYNAATGAEAWAAHYGGVAADYAQRATALAPDGSKVYLTGGGLGDYVTVAYETS